MKKLFLVLAVGFVAVGMAFSASLAVGGNVSTNLSVALDDTALTITFDGQGAAGAVVDTPELTVLSNKKLWTITFNSTNDGVLLSDTITGEDPIPYLVQVTLTTQGWTGTLSNSLSSAVQIGAANKTIVATGDSRTNKNGIAFDIVVSAVAQGDTDKLWEAGTDYKDTITIDIASP